MYIIRGGKSREKTSETRYTSLRVGRRDREKKGGVLSPAVG